LNCWMPIKQPTIIHRRLVFWLLRSPKCLKFSQSRIFACVHLTWELVHFQCDSTWNINFRPQIDYTKMPKFETSVHILMQHHPMSINMHGLIEVRWIGGEIALYVSSKTVIYSVMKNSFFKYTKFGVLTVV
jgi:hypothetical protein